MQKRGKKSRFNFFVLFFALLVCCLFVVANLRVYQKRQVLKSELDNLTTGETYRGTVQNNGPDNPAASGFSLEKMAREELDMQKEGEKVVAFVGLVSATASVQQKERKGFWQSIWDWGWK